MPVQHRLHGDLPYIVCIQGVTHIVVCWSITASEIGRILKKVCAAEGKRNHTSVRNFVERMAEGVIDLKKALAPAIEPLLERDNHAVVVGDGPRGVFGDLAEPGVGTGRNRRTATQLRRKRPKTKCISGRI